MTKHRIIISMILYCLIISACGNNLDETVIQTAIITADRPGEQPAQTFGPEEAIYYRITLAEAVDEAKAVWRGPAPTLAE